MAKRSGWTVETLKDLHGREAKWLRRLLKERDHRYEDRWKADHEALTVAKHENDESAARLGEALTTYKNNANEWQNTFREFQETTLPRGETLAMFREQSAATSKNAEDINMIMRGESRGAGGAEAIAKARQQMNWMIGIGIAIAGMIISATIGSLGIIGGLIYFLLSHK